MEKEGKKESERRNSSTPERPRIEKDLKKTDKPKAKQVDKGMSKGVQHQLVNYSVGWKGEKAVESGVLVDPVGGRG